MSRDFPALGFDPAPGEPGAVESLRARLSTVSTTLTEARTTTAGIAQASGWEGPAAAAFRGSVGEFPPHLDAAASAMTVATAVLDVWHADLSSLQHIADQLEAEAADAKRQIEQARSNPALPTLGDVGVFITEVTGGDAEAARQAQAALDQAEQRYEEIKERAERLKDQHEELATETASRLRQAGEGAPEERGLFGRVADFLGFHNSKGDVSDRGPHGDGRVLGPNVRSNIDSGFGNQSGITRPSLINGTLLGVEGGAYLGDVRHSGNTSIRGLDLAGNLRQTIGAEGIAALSVNERGLLATARGNAGIRARAEGGAHLGSLTWDGYAEHFTGVEAGAGLSATPDGVGVNANAFAGERLSVGLGSEVVDGLRTGAEGEVWAGAGVDAGANFGRNEDGSFTIGAHAGAAVGYGGRLGVDITVDPDQFVNSARDAGESLRDTVDSVGDTIGGLF